MTPLVAAPSPPQPSPPALVAPAPAPSGRAEFPPATPQDLTFAADELEADPAARSVTLRGGVTLGYGRYRLTAKSLRLTFTKDAITFDGEARLAFCPCASPPITIAARAGRLSAPGDLVLRFPRVELFGFPVFALPALWARAPSEPGLLPPVITLRGDDGLLVGAGVHLPFRGEDGKARVLDLTAGGYLKGGAALGVALDTPASSSRLTADLIHGERLAIEARGAEAAGPSAALAWEADVIRGDRARSGTVELTPAAAPFDHAAFEASLRTEGYGLTARPGALVATGLLARAGRGEGAWILGPTAHVAMSGPLGVTSSHASRAALGAFGVSAEGLVLGDATGGLALPVGRASTWVELDQKAGPIALSLRGGGSLIATGAAPPLTPLTPSRPPEGAPLPPFEASAGESPAFDVRAGARLRAELPLIRAFTARPAEAPLVHWVAPTLEASFLASASRGAFLEPLVPLAGAGAERPPMPTPPTLPSVSGLLPRPFAALAVGGISTAIGRYAGPAARLDLRAGALARPDAPIAALASARLEASAPTALASVALALTSSRDPDAASAATAGLALTARARLGAPESFGAALDLASNTGPDAREARGLDDPEGAALGASPAFFRGEGTTFGLALIAPVFASIRASLRADADLTHAALLAVRGAAAYRDPCGCFALSLDAARRLGRGGVDVSFALSLTPPVR